MYELISGALFGHKVLVGPFYARLLFTGQLLLHQGSHGSLLLSPRTVSKNICANIL